MSAGVSDAEGFSEALCLASQEACIVFYAELVFEVAKAVHESIHK